MFTRSLLIALVCILPTLGADLVLPNGQEFKDYEVKRVEPDGITVSHAAGVSKVYYSEMPREMQQVYGYSRQAALDYRKASAQRQADAWQAAQSVAATHALSDAIHMETSAALREIRKTGVDLAGDVLLVDDAGAILYNLRVPVRYKVKRPGPVPLEAAKQYETRTEYAAAAEWTYEVYVLGLTGNVAEGEMWAGTVYPAGTIRSGKDRTLRCVAVTAEAALAALLAAAK